MISAKMTMRTARQKCHQLAEPEQLYAFCALLHASYAFQVSGSLGRADTWLERMRPCILTVMVWKEFKTHSWRGQAQALQRCSLP